jgi:hypothetical protein
MKKIITLITIISLTTLFGCSEDNALTEKTYTDVEINKAAAELCNNGHLAYDIISRYNYGWYSTYNGINVTDIMSNKKIEDITDICSEKLNEQFIEYFDDKKSSIVELNNNFFTINGNSYPIVDIRKISGIDTLKEIKIKSLNKTYFKYSFTVETKTYEKEEAIFFNKEVAINARNKIINTDVEIRVPTIIDND